MVTCLPGSQSVRRVQRWPSIWQWWNMKNLLVVIAAVGVVILIGYGRSRMASAKDTATDVSTVITKRGSIRTVVSCTGRVVANQNVEIKCKASGAVTTLPFDVSDTVNKGDLLLQIDPVDEERTARQADSALAASQAKLETARINLSVARRDFDIQKRKAEAGLRSARIRASDARTKSQRLKELLSKKISSTEEVETAETNAAQLDVELELSLIQVDDLVRQEEALGLKEQDVKLAQAQVESDKLNVEIRRQSLADTKVVAPISGVVSSRSVQQGQIISSGISNIGGGTTAMILSDLSSIFILASVDESDIGKMQVGQQAAITADAFPGSAFEGRVQRVATQGTSVSNVVTFEVKIEVISQNKLLLKPEMTANVTIVAAHKDDVLLVPAEAVVRKAKEHFVEVAKEAGAKEERKVEVGLSDGTQREIVRGLTEGDAVVVHKDTDDSKWTGQNQMPPPPMGPPPGSVKGRS
jgi:HlyD family secretion protein